MRILMIAAAAISLSACETLDQAFQPTTGARPSAAAPASATPASAPATIAAPPPSLNAEQQLLEAERLLAAAAQERGLGAALAGALDPAQGFVVRPGREFESAEAVAAGLPNTATGPIFWQPDRVVTSAGSDLALTSGRYVQVVRGAEAQQGRYVIVWRRVNGAWKILNETRTADPAAAPAARRRR